MVHKYMTTLLVLALLALLGLTLSGCEPRSIGTNTPGTNQYRTYHQADGVACYTTSTRGEFSCVQVTGNGEPDPALQRR